FVRRRERRRDRGDRPRRGRAALAPRARAAGTPRSSGRPGHHRRCVARRGGARVRSLTNADWYLLRGSGVVALILFTLVFALGIATSKRWRLARLPKFVTLGLHRNVSLLAVAFLGIHIATAMLDSYAH